MKCKHLYLLFQVFSSSNKAWNLSKSSFNSWHCKLDLLMKNIKMENLILITFADRAEHFTCVPVVQSILINNSSLHLEYTATVRSPTHLIYCQSFLCLLNIYRHNLPMQSRRMLQLLLIHCTYTLLILTSYQATTPT